MINDFNMSISHKYRIDPPPPLPSFKFNQNWKQTKGHDHGKTENLKVQTDAYLLDGNTDGLEGCRLWLFCSLLA